MSLPIKLIVFAFLTVIISGQPVLAAAGKGDPNEESSLNDYLKAALIRQQQQQQPQNKPAPPNPAPEASPPPPPR